MPGTVWTFRECGELWRFFVPTITCQGVGALIGLGFGLAEFPFLDVWTGGAVAGPIGAVAGLIWHAADPYRRRTTRTGIAIFGVAIVFVIAAVAFFYEIPGELRARDEIAQLRSLDPSTIHAIVLLEEHDKPPLRIADSRAIAEFAEACRDIEKSNQGHLRVRQEWRVLVLAAAGRRELECDFVEGQDDEVIADLIIPDTLFRRQVRSRTLRAWLDRYAVVPQSN